MNYSRIFTITILFTVICFAESIQESQLNLASYTDSNPTESLSNPQGALGLKAKGSLKFSQDRSRFQSYGSLIGQGFLEPGSNNGSKFILNAETGINLRLGPNLELTSMLKTFRKMYFYDLRRSGWNGLELCLAKVGSQGFYQRFGYALRSDRIDYGSLLQFTEQKVFLNVNRFIKPHLFGEVTLSGGQVDYKDIPGSIFNHDILTLLDDQHQQDQFWQLLLHMRIINRFIYGFSLSYEDVTSNSVVAESDIFIARIYASGGLGKDYFIHAVIQGMNKNYAHPGNVNVGSDGDLEERIQNQFHLQLERILPAGKIIYVQYSYLKNETLITNWFYEKNQFEVGVKLEV